MTHRTCSTPECDRPHWARGMCSSHYGTWHRKKHGRTNNHKMFPIVCIVCGADHQASRPQSKFCSDSCKGMHYSETMRTKSKLPADHPVIVRIKQAREAAAASRKAEQKYSWRIARQCPGCSYWFTPIYTSSAIACSKRCSRRIHRWRRKAREAGATGAFTYSDFMHIAARFDYRCAYCNEKPTGLLEPDHVVPLSRGGSNSTTNLLPSCHQCNADKSAHLLHEWADRRAAQGKPSRATSWAPEDRRYWHLTDAMLISPAA